MKTETHYLHSQLIRFAKGALRAWEHWLEAQKRDEYGTDDNGKLQQRPRDNATPRTNGSLHNSTHEGASK